MMHQPYERKRSVRRPGLWIPALAFLLLPLSGGPNRPGARRIIAFSNWDPLLVTAFANPDGSVAVVVMNTSDAPIGFQAWMEGQAVTTTSPARSIMTIML